MRDSFIFYRSWLEAIKNLPREIQGEVLMAIIAYGLNGEISESLKPITRAMLAMVKTQIDINNKRFANGCKGGRPIKASNQAITKQKPGPNQTETNQEPNVHDNAHDNAAVEPDGSLSGDTSPDMVDAVDYRIFADWFNTETKGVFGIVKYPLGEKRKAFIRARIREHGRQSVFDAVKKAFQSDFLKGNSQRGFVATFDWIFNPSNFEKILSGNYDNNRSKKRAEENGGIDEELMQHVAAGIARAKFDKENG